MTATAAERSTVATMPHLDSAILRNDFPILNRPPRNGRTIAFLDSAASSQKPQVVIDTLNAYYTETNANIHRGVYDLSERATSAFESVRKQTANFINASSPREIVFVRNTTEAINLVAQSWGRANLAAGDLIAFTAMEHHSNIVPWQLIAEQSGADIAYIGVTSDGRLDLESFDQILARGPRLIAITQVSNALGTINPVKELVRHAHAAGALVLVDGAQCLPHMTVDVQDLDCDFLAFSGHKMLGPMGAGVLYGKKHLLDAMPPYMGGGSMIRKVTLEKTTFADSPAKFEAGTPSVGDVIAFGAALTYLETIGMDRIHEFESAMTTYLLARLNDVSGLTIIGPNTTVDRSAVVSFTIDDVHPHDVAAILDEDNIAVRAGHHCAQPLLHALGVAATTRASVYLYNTHQDIDRLATSLERAYKIFH